MNSYYWDKSVKLVGILRNHNDSFRFKFHWNIITKNLIKFYKCDLVVPMDCHTKSSWSIILMYTIMFNKGIKSHKAWPYFKLLAKGGEVPSGRGCRSYWSSQHHSDLYLFPIFICIFILICICPIDLHNITQICICFLFIVVSLP